MAAEAVTLHLRLGWELTAVEFNKNAPLVFQTHHMFWSVPLIALLSL
ncbi:MAG TPA: hypothetical protein VNH11_10800 [Pirellulales bacterium]|nr:hypothetical protein [Pirellulales bacterium]